MSNRPQNSAKGHKAFTRITLAASGEFWSGDYSSSAKALSFDSNGAVLAGGVKISNAQLITANSYGLIAGNTTSVLPGNVTTGAYLGFLSNSTGKAAFINLTGTTNVYFNTTTKQPGS